MTTLHVVRVFVGHDGGGGNPLGVFLHGPQVPDQRRQAVAADLGFSETVFVDDPVDGQLRIFTPGTELGFAGHPLVGTAWLLARELAPVATLRPPAGPVPTWEDDAGVRWIRARPEWAPPMALRQLDSPAAVDAAQQGDRGVPQTHVWAWEDEAAGRVRARNFAPGLGIPEDEATGAAAVLLGAALGREIVVRQGAGSLLHARPGPDGTVEVGGAVASIEVRDYAA